MESFARILKLLGHPDRLRILALLRRGELTVSELVSVLELSQPRVTQYIRSLEEGGVIERLREGSWVFSRLRTEDGVLSALVDSILDNLPAGDEILAADRHRLQAVRSERAGRADRFFADVANNRGRLSHEFLPQAPVEAAILDQVGTRRFERMVDLGTGSGRMLILFADRVASGIGIDLSPDMLRVARHMLVEDRFAHLTVQQSDLAATPLQAGCADLVTLHQVLHHLDRPGDALAEAERLLKPDGILLIVDFAAHDHEDFRDRYAHRRLGFDGPEIAQALQSRRFGSPEIRRVRSETDGMPDLLIWTAARLASPEPGTVT